MVDPCWLQTLGSPVLDMKYKLDSDIRLKDVMKNCKVTLGCMRLQDIKQSHLELGWTEPCSLGEEKEPSWKGLLLLYVIDLKGLKINNVFVNLLSLI